MLPFVASRLWQKTRKHHVHNPDRTVLAKNGFGVGWLPSEEVQVLPKDFREGLIVDCQIELFTEHPCMFCQYAVELTAFEELLPRLGPENEQFQAFQEVQAICDDSRRIDDGSERRLFEKLGELRLLLGRQFEDILQNAPNR
jgi:hypothetical protein